MTKPRTKVPAGLASTRRADGGAGRVGGAANARRTTRPVEDPSDACDACGDECGDVCEVQVVNAPRLTQARRAMQPPEAVGTLAETFKVLGDPTRLRIAWALAGGELCVCDLAALLHMSQSAVSHSLRALRQLRLVR